MNHPQNNVTPREEMISQPQMFNYGPANAYGRQQATGPQFINTNMRRMPPRVLSAPGPNYAIGPPALPTAPGHEFSRQYPGMFGMSNRIDQGHAPHNMVMNRQAPRTYSPMGLAPTSYGYPGDVAHDGSFQPRQKLIQTAGIEMHNPMMDQRPINETESNSVSSDDKFRESSPVFSGHIGSTHKVNAGVNGVIKEEDYHAEKFSRENHSAGGSGRLGSVRNQHPVPSQYSRNPVNFQPVPDYDTPISGNFIENRGNRYSPQSNAYHHQEQEKEYYEYVDENARGYNDPDMEEGEEVDYQNYAEQGQPKVGGHARQHPRELKEAAYSQQTTKSKAGKKPKEKKKTRKSSKERDHLETYEPHSNRNSPGYHQPGRSPGGGSSMSYDWSKQQGSRSIQGMLGGTDKKAVDNLVRQLIPELGEISMNIFGNYVAQKMIEVGTLL